MKSVVALVRDHSGSMKPNVRLAMQDYNDNLRTLKELARTTGVDTSVSVVKCGVGYLAKVELEVSRRNILALPELRTYQADGTRTPLWDSVDLAIDDLRQVDDPEAVFVVMVTTDGMENASQLTGKALRRRIEKLQATDRWSFVFRVPDRRPLISALDIADGNVLEWEQTDAGFAEATRRQDSAIRGYYQGLTQGVTKTTRFYSNLDQVEPAELGRLRDIADRVAIWHVQDGRPTIEAFCNRHLRKDAYMPGLAFYQLVKPELVQERKEILIRDRQSGAVFTGSEVRSLLGLPRFGAVRLYPGRHGQYEVFVQSTSRNRILPIGSKLVYLTEAS